MTSLNKAAIQELIPHRDPFLWIDEVVEADAGRIVARRFVDPALDVFRGHYPGRPILPGVLLCEAAMQAGAVLIAQLPEGALRPEQVPVATRLTHVKFKQVGRPGDTLTIEVKLSDRAANAFFLTAKVSVAGRTAATLEFACAAAEV
ncbi:MAG: 3-hydroxyacyl-ACP dehydratase FabZ family protein [Planctomycetaceae bacterium]